MRDMHTCLQLRGLVPTTNDARTQKEHHKILMQFYSTTIFYFCYNCGVSGISSPSEGVNAKWVKQKPKKI